MTGFEHTVRHAFGRCLAHWTWAILLVVLYSAIPGTSYQPTQRLGSAFDPTNVQVSVGPRKPVAEAQAEARRHPDVPPRVILAAKAEFPVETLLQQSPAAGASDTLPPATDHRDMGQSGPRAPPLSA